METVQRPIASLQLVLTVGGVDNFLKTKKNLAQTINFRGFTIVLEKHDGQTWASVAATHNLNKKQQKELLRQWIYNKDTMEETGKKWRQTSDDRQMMPVHATKL